MQQAGVSTEAISNLLEATSKKLRAAETAHGEQALMRQQLALEEETRQIAVRLKSGEDVDV